MATVMQLALELSQAFEGATRANGDEIRKLKDGSPEWMTDVVHAAHGDMMPDDWRYNAIEDAADRISELDDPDDAGDAMTEYCDSADAYNGRLVQWLASNLTRACYVEDAMTEFGTCGINSREPDFFQLLRMGQYQERAEVWSLLTAALTELANDDDDSDA
jgi:hypothetical protein